MRAAVIGAGAVGARAARHLLTLGDLDRLTLADRDRSRADAVARSLGSAAQAVDLSSLAFEESDVVVLAHAAPQEAARGALQAGAHVVVTSGLLGTARDLALLDAEARERQRNVVIGAGLSPGLSCLLVLEAVLRLESVTSIEVASAGAAGPACAADRREALGRRGLRWDGAWHSERPGTGRRLAAFPDPVGSKDCFAAGTSEAFLLGRAFPNARVSTAVAATAAERATARFPRFQPRRTSEAALGAVRVEVHGRTHEGGSAARVLGAIDRPAVAGGAVAAVAARWAVAGRLSRCGAAGLASVVGDPQAFLRDLATLGVRAAEYAPSY